MPRISELPIAGGLTGSEIFALDQGGVTKQAGTDDLAAYVASAINPAQTFQFALSDMVTDLATGALSAGWIVPFDCTIGEVFIGLAAARSSSGPVTVDALLSGATIFSTMPSIADGDDTSLTGTAAVLSTTAATKGQVLTFSIIAAGTGARGLIATIEVTPA